MKEKDIDDLIYKKFNDNPFRYIKRNTLARDCRINPRTADKWLKYYCKHNRIKLH